LVISFEIGEEPDLFEEFVAEVLRFVDDEDDRVAGVHLGEDEFIEDLKVCDAVDAARFETELQYDGFEELVCAQARVEDERGLEFVAEFFEELAADRGLAGADFAGEFDEAFALVDAEEQMVERLLMFPAEEQKARVRRDVERLFPQVVKLEIQRFPPIRP
jgi:hypothetical protein